MKMFFFGLLVVMVLCVPSQINAQKSESILDSVVTRTGKLVTIKCESPNKFWGFTLEACFEVKYKFPSEISEWGVTYFGEKTSPKNIITEAILGDYVLEVNDRYHAFSAYRTKQGRLVLRVYPKE